MIKSPVAGEFLKLFFYHRFLFKYIMLIKHKFSLLNTYVVDGKADEQKK